MVVKFLHAINIHSKLANAFKSFNPITCSLFGDKFAKNVIFVFSQIEDVIFLEINFLKAIALGLPILKGLF